MIYEKQTDATIPPKLGSNEQTTINQRNNLFLWSKEQQTSLYGTGVKYVENFRKTITRIMPNSLLGQDFYYRLTTSLFLGQTSSQIQSLPKRLLTKDVVPKAIHSHNDYWRELPLFDALTHGATSVEADVWYVKNSYSKYVLAVGHNKAYLDTENTTLYNLYTGPLLALLKPPSALLKKNPELKETGVFYNEPHRTLYLYIDFKTEADVETYELLLKYLAPLVDCNLVSYYDLMKEVTVSRPITVIATGNYPEYLATAGGQLSNNLQGSFKRYVFKDLTMLPVIDNETDLDTFGKELEKVVKRYSEDFNALTASISFKNFIKDFTSFTKHDPNDYLRRYIEICHKYNLKVRIWDTPEWPLANAVYVWQKLINYYKVDLLCVDNLDLACSLQELHTFDEPDIEKSQHKLPSYEIDDNVVNII
ncbi:hypothetical protein TPHA_0O01890 [Tetrapisispora phaffii CBS 4417]|uniref:Altered inheritance of mitochondria protein 6 n=1 Tax=Tetrapisispora phaffii (strain ATCC 24235 / CBS 4417 / NBRC 1672 / NRRL Y-8282 / UCD 70-5) TaxID=1071381 RepID=G8C1X8_TETPH|nr:hypothetical protein TPHA_0O01890 [Tetrapisispora phaffii CBS 4417]CCE66156.1 hypothetical protein TPHA_0O01890 [Tetrapisispora phaffii CBS 4417]